MVVPVRLLQAARVMVPQIAAMRGSEALTVQVSRRVFSALALEHAPLESRPAGLERSSPARGDEPCAWQNWMPPENDQKIKEVSEASLGIKKINPEDIKLNFAKLN